MSKLQQQVYEAIVDAEEVTDEVAENILKVTKDKEISHAAVTAAVLAPGFVLMQELPEGADLTTMKYIVNYLLMSRGMPAAFPDAEFPDELRERIERRWRKK